MIVIRCVVVGRRRYLVHLLEDHKNRVKDKLDELLALTVEASTALSGHNFSRWVAEQRCPCPDTGCTCFVGAKEAEEIFSKPVHCGVENQEKRRQEKT